MPSAKPPFPRFQRRHSLAVGNVGEWQFYEGLGGSTLHDISGREQNGSLAAMDPATDWVGGLHGWELDFNGANDRIPVGTPTAMPQWSIVAVATASGINAVGNVIFSNDAAGFSDDVSIGVRPDGTSTANRWGIVNQDSGGSIRTFAEDSVNVVLNRTYHLAGTSDGLSLRFYVDGALVDTTAKNGTALTFGANTTVIGSTGVSNRWFEGQISHVALYDRTLSAAEISLHARDPFILGRPPKAVLRSGIARPLVDGSLASGRTGLVA